MLRGDSYEFPPTHLALNEPNGLLAVGGDLSSQRLTEAYRHGIFPWFEDDQPILWWSPSPRAVIFPDQVHCSKSMNKWLRKTPYQICIDRDFAAVLKHCSGARKNANGTWITDSMKRAYTQLHHQGIAHSIEAYEGNYLVGGLYGVSLGKVFFGESMFSKVTNASKMALIYLARFLEHRGFTLIDCQVGSEHVMSLGAVEIHRSLFEQYLHTNQALPDIDSLTWHNSANKVISRDGHLVD